MLYICSECRLERKIGREKNNDPVPCDTSEGEVLILSVTAIFSNEIIVISDAVFHENLHFSNCVVCLSWEKSDTFSVSGLFGISRQSTTVGG